MVFSPSALQEGEVFTTLWTSKLFPYQNLKDYTLLTAGRTAGIQKSST